MIVAIGSVIQSASGGFGLGAALLWFFAYETVFQLGFLMTIAGSFFLFEAPANRQGGRVPS
jgi:hypothetical protein